MKKRRMLYNTNMKEFIVNETEYLYAVNCAHSHNAQFIT